SVGQIREILPYLCLMYTSRWPHVGVNIDEPRYNCFSRNINHLCVGWYLNLALGANRRDSIVGDNNIAALDNLIALTRDDPSTAKHHSTFRSCTWSLDNNIRRFGFIGTYFLPVELGAP